MYNNFPCVKKRWVAERYFGGIVKSINYATDEIARLVGEIILG